MSKMFYKQVLRATNLPKTANIEQNLMDYILNEGAHSCRSSEDAIDVWRNKFVGFFTDNSNPEWGFGYHDLKDPIIHYPIFTDIIQRQLESEEDYLEKPYLVMFYGSDNHSLFVRFSTDTEVIQFLNKNHKSMEQIENNYDMHYYNS